MPPRPHIVSNGRPALRGDLATTNLVETEFRGDAGRTAWDRDGDAADREFEDRALSTLRRRRRAQLSSIIGIEAVVFLVILSTLARESADLRQSTWALAGLSMLFLVLTRLRRWATVSASED